MKVNFRKLEVYTDIGRTKPLLVDIAKDLANGLYQFAQGIEAHALALKIYNAEGEEEYSEDELRILLRHAEKYSTPLFISALQELLDKQHINEQ